MPMAAISASSLTLIMLYPFIYGLKYICKQSKDGPHLFQQLYQHKVCLFYYYHLRNINNILSIEYQNVKSGNHPSLVVWQLCQ